MEKASGLKVEYVKPREDINPKDDHKRLVRFITLFAQVGFQELYLNPDTKIKFDYSK
ncbi:MAG TPA: hypothetical protein H9673_05240 [Candidatus Adamsella sp.]|nr:hypothetical protein [Candidatus Adamsella sp.]